MAGTTAEADEETFDLGRFLAAGGNARLRRCLSRQAGQRGADVRDVAQEVLVRAHDRQRVVPFGSADDFLCWAVRVGRNVLVDEQRRVARRQIVPLDTLAGRDAAVPDHADATARRVALHDALRALPGRQGDVLWATDAEQRPHAEVAAALGTSVGSVRQLRHRAITALRRVSATALALAVLPTRLLTLLRRPRHVAHPMIGASVVVLVIAPVTGPLPIEADAPSGRHAARTGGPVREPRSERGSKPPGTAGPVATASGKTVGRWRSTGTLPPRLDARACVSVRDKQVCGTTGPRSKPKPGDTLWITVPGPAVPGGQDVTVDIRQDEIPACDYVPRSPYTGCDRTPR